jgi:hypothetical protein
MQAIPANDIVLKEIIVTYIEHLMPFLIAFDARRKNIVASPRMVSPSLDNTTTTTSSTTARNSVPAANNNRMEGSGQRSIPPPTRTTSLGQMSQYGTVNHPTRTRPCRHCSGEHMDYLCPTLSRGSGFGGNPSRVSGPGGN